MPELVDAIDAVLAAKGRDEWGEIFDREGLIWGPVLTLDEVAEDPQAEAIGMFPAIEHAERGSYRSVRAPMRIPRCRRAAARAGAGAGGALARRARSGRLRRGRDRRG
jgi:crotonobetainyl-CoA:carnitine CoA-transferase CaiB-like acyl-CoA transferase